MENSKIMTTETKKQLKDFGFSLLGVIGFISLVVLLSFILLPSLKF